MTKLLSDKEIEKLVNPHKHSYIEELKMDNKKLHTQYGVIVSLLVISLGYFTFIRDSVTVAVDAYCGAVSEQQRLELRKAFDNRIQINCEVD